MTFGESKLEVVILGLLADQGYPHTLGSSIRREPEDVLIDSEQLNLPTMSILSKFMP